MTSETLWQEITVAALLGTQRKPFQPTQAGGTLEALLQAASAGPDGSPPADTERGLLRMAAIAAMHRRAGQLPPLGSPALPAPCPADRWVRCSTAAGSFLERILVSGHGNLLAEWAALAAAHHQRVREEHLPLILDQQKLIQPIRATVLPVLGERGRWLAAQNPDWAEIFPSLDERTWTEGQRKQRMAFLSDLRGQDPAGARELLVSTWSQESPGDRVVFLQVLAEGLNMADEPFLEAVLDDRRKDVRQAAANLLAALPESRLVKRMTNRARQLLNWKPGLLRSTLEVTLPEACDAEMLRDGLEARPPSGHRLGEKAWWLVQVLSCVPPRSWSSAWNKRPQQILELVRKHEWEEALLEGFQQAAVRAQDSDWIEALISYANKNGDGQRLMALFPTLPVSAKERLVLATLRDNPSLSYEQPGSILLSACRHPWSAELSQAVVACVCASLIKNEMLPWRWEKLMRDIPPYFHPDLLQPALERIAAALKKKADGDPMVSGLLVTLEFRLAMRRAFHPTA